MKKIAEILVNDAKRKALNASDDDVLALTDEEILAMNPVTEFDEIDLAYLKADDQDYFYELKDELRKVQKEMRETLKVIAEDTKVLKDPQATWLGDEKTEWMHELSAKRLWLEELNKKRNELRRQLYALTKGNTNGRGKK